MELGKRQSLSESSGVALILVVIASFAILTAAALIVTRLHEVKRSSDSAMHRAIADEALKAGIDVAISRVWHRFRVSTQPDEDGLVIRLANVESYRKFLDDEIVRNGETRAMLTDGQSIDLAAGGVAVTALSVSRNDDTTGTVLTLNATARSVDGDIDSAVQTVRVGGEPFTGLDFALMSNRSTCVFCHADVLPVEMLDKGLTPIDLVRRVRVASLEDFFVDLDGEFAANSTIAGTLYTRGNIRNPGGSAISADQLAGSTLGAYKLREGTDKLEFDVNGDLIEVSFTETDVNEEGALSRFGNLYVDYPVDEADMADGQVPTAFPPAFPDPDGDRLVSDDEYANIAANVNGRVTGGIALGVANGTTYAGGDLPIVPDANTMVGLNDGEHSGNLFLVGTQSNPIEFSRADSSTPDEDGKAGTVAIDGDLVIKGTVKGKGQLYVRGNVYIVGDLTYADEPGKFGEANDGTENGLAITPGGNILIGDFLTRRGKNDDGAFGAFTALEVDYRLADKELSTTDGSQRVDVGYFADNVVDPGLPSMLAPTDPDFDLLHDEDITSFATSEMMLFNQDEFIETEANPDYVPRYYQMRPGAPVWAFDPLPSNAQQYTIRYNDPLARQLDGNHLDKTNAVVMSLTPKNGWVTEDQLRRFWFMDEQYRPDLGRPFTIDAFLYTNNAIIGIMHSKSRHNSNTYGRLVLRGAMIARDLGVLAPGDDQYLPRKGMSLYRDPRISDFVRIENTEKVVFERRVFRKTAAG